MKSRKSLILLCALILYLVFFNFILIFFNNQNSSSSVFNKNEIPSQKKYVIITSSLEENKDYYMFYLPIAAKCWQQIGFQPVLLLISSDYSNLDRLSVKTIEYLDALNITYIQVQAKHKYETITSMVARLLIGIIDNSIIDDDSFVITTDVDLIPINPYYYSLSSMNLDIITVWNAYCCDGFYYSNRRYSMFPMSHVGMVKRN